MDVIRQFFPPWDLNEYWNAGFSTNRMQDFEGYSPTYGLYVVFFPLGVYRQDMEAILFLHFFT